MLSNCTQKSFQIKPSFLGRLYIIGFERDVLGEQGKKITAKSEKEAAEADLKTAKMQVQATEAAENLKNGT